MAEPATVLLSRILYILPVAARDGGASVDELAAALDITPQQVVDAINQVITRSYYHPAGPAEELQVGLEHGRVTVWTTGEFRRPARLSPLEALALGLGLRALAAETRADRRAELLALAARLERDLAPPPEPEHVGASAGGTRTREELRRKYDPAYRDEAAPARAPSPAFTLALVPDADVLGVLADAARECCRCVVVYLKQGAAAPEERRIAPYMLLHAEGEWYVLAHDADRDAPRLFRVDRMLSAQLDRERFTVPEDFDPRPWIAPDGRLYRADEDSEVVVRYSPRIARWLAERTEHEPQPDGGIVVRHRVADVRWIVRHVLQYGGEAEVLEPAHVRVLVAEAAERLAG
ncbi:MAG TPA: WYL domain-containing protein [Longimicrobiales bacterium]